MFVERFDALMNIAELSNSQLGREISMNPSRIGRLHSGARPLPKHHEFLPGMCAYLAAHLPCEGVFVIPQGRDKCALTTAPAAA